MTVVYKRGDSIKPQKTSIALGTFDGLHVAHMMIIDKAVSLAKENNLKSGVLTFDSIPSNLINANSTPKIMSLDDKLELLDKLDFLYVETFDKEFMNKSPNEFVDYLKNKLNVSCICVGYDYRFGKGGLAGAQDLKALAKESGISVYVLDKFELDGEVVSSTKIRGYILSGQIEKANKFLGRPFHITGIVEHGLNNGTKMGIPTANIIKSPEMICLKHGVYAGYCIVDGCKYKAVINVGNNPTFNGKHTTIECHLLDYSGDLYSKTIKAQFLKFIRDEINFESKDKLVEQIAKDIDFALKTLTDF